VFTNLLKRLRERRLYIQHKVERRKVWETLLDEHTFAISVPALDSSSNWQRG